MAEKFVLSDARVSATIGMKRGGFDAMPRGLRLRSWSSLARPRDMLYVVVPEDNEDICAWADWEDGYDEEDDCCVADFMEEERLGEDLEKEQNIDVTKCVESQTEKDSLSYTL